MNSAIEGLTLVELIVVCVILGVLLRLGSVVYSKTHEKARAAEARSMLGYIRTAEESYRLDNDTYTDNLSRLDVDVQKDCSEGRQYFSYALGGVVDSDHFNATATRCTAGGKVPQGNTAYTIVLDQGGNLTVAAGY